MSRPAKGTRLVWRKEYRRSDGKVISRAGWYIQDGSKRTRISEDLGPADREQAEKWLADYIASRHQPIRESHSDPSAIKVADVISVYLEDKAPQHARPKETAARFVEILNFFGDKMLTEINGKLCRSYVKQASAITSARRQLEDLRSAIRYYHKQGYVLSIPSIVLPEKSESRIRWLTRQETARLLWAAWRMKATYKGKPVDFWTGRHVARFILIGLYTGTRSGAICTASFKLQEGSGYIDLERGVFHRRAMGARETNKRQPPVRLPDRLLAHMTRWSKNQTYVVEFKGKPVKSIKKAFKEACRLADLGWYDEKDQFHTDVTPHVLRHTAATWLMQNGASLTDAADYLGMTEEVLRAHYYHAHPDFQKDVANRITQKK